jgi:hypothetical protein
MGKFKWDNLCIDYPLLKTRPANETDITRAKKILGIG